MDIIKGCTMALKEDFETRRENEQKYQIEQCAK